MLYSLILKKKTKRLLISYLSEVIFAQEIHSYFNVVFFELPFFIDCLKLPNNIFAHASIRNKYFFSQNTLVLINLSVVF